MNHTDAVWLTRQQSVHNLAKATPTIFLSTTTTRQFKCHTFTLSSFECCPMNDVECFARS